MRVCCKFSKGFYGRWQQRPDSVKGKDGHFLRGRNSRNSSIAVGLKINKITFQHVFEEVQKE